VDQITQLKGISNINVFGAGQYAMRFWVKPDQLAKLNITVSDIITAINAQNTSIPPVWSAARRRRKDRNSPTPSPRRAGS
jgi:multidrug efflux pump subunit AcrB